MNIFYITQFYKPENIAAAFRASEHAEKWAAHGERVVVYTAYPNYPVGKIFDGYENDGLTIESRGNPAIVRNRIIIKSNTTLANRIINGSSYMFYGMRNLRKDEVREMPCDVVLASSGPIFTGILGYYAASVRRVPFVLELRDIAYKQMIATGMSEKSLKVRAMRSVELFLARRAARVIVLTKGFKDVLIKEGISPKKIDVVPNGADLVSCAHQWSSKLRLGYFGTMGISQDIGRTLLYSDDLFNEGLLEKYILIGEGAARAVVEEASAGRSYIELLHGMEKDRLENYYGQVDMTLVSLKGDENFAETIPSKIFQSFARGVPVLFIGPAGEAAELIEQAGGGLVLTGDDEQNIRTIHDFVRSGDVREKLENMSRSCKKYIEVNYTREVMANKVSGILNELIS